MTEVEINFNSQDTITSGDFLNHLSKKAPGKQNDMLNNSEQAAVLQNRSRGISLPGGKFKLRTDGKGIERRDDGLLISPKPGFVIKTKKLTKHNRKQQKVFINACSNENIQEPKKAKKLDDNGKEAEGLNVPVAVGPLRDCLDKSGSNCRVVDCVVHPKVIEDCVCNQNLNTSFRHFICQVLINYVNSKYKEFGILDERYKLPKLIYQGFVDKRTGKQVKKNSEFAEVCKQWVKDSSKRPTIHEVSSNSLKPSTKKPINSNAKKSNIVSKISFDIFIEDGNGYKMTLLEFLSAMMKTDIHSNDPLKQLLEEEITSIQNFGLRVPLVWNIPCNVHSDNNGPFSPRELLLTTEIPSDLDPAKIEVHLSAFMCTLSLPENRFSIDCILPFPVHTKTALTKYEPGRRILSISINFIINMNLDHSSDPGSTPWKLQRGLSAPSNPKKDSRTSKMKDNDPKSKDSFFKSESQGHEEFPCNSVNKKQSMISDPSNYFLLNPTSLSSSFSLINKPPRQKKFGNLGEELPQIPNLPEDQFHSNDPMSRFMIEQQEKEKAEKYHEAEVEHSSPSSRICDIQAGANSFHSEKKTVSVIDKMRGNQEDPQRNLIDTSDGKICNMKEKIHEIGSNFRFSNNLWANIIM